MKFWQSLAFVEMDQMVELAQFCEQLGFHGVSYGDHLVTTKEQLDAYLYRDSGEIFWSPETHWADPWVLASTLAQATTTLHFLSTIYILPLREPLSVAKSLVAAVPDEIRGDEVAACIVLASGHQADEASATRIVSFCLQQLAYFKVPGYVIFCDDLPKTASNKPKRADVKVLARQRVDQQDCYDTRAMKKRQ